MKRTGCLSIVVMGTSLLMYIAIKQYFVTEKLLQTGTYTKATVVDFDTHTNNDGDTMYTPVFEYVDRVLNTKKRFESSVSSGSRDYEIGEMVEIIYDTQNNQQKVVSFWGLYRATIIMSSMAWPFLVFCIGYLLYRLK